MRRFGFAIAATATAFGMTHLVLIEVGREVVALRTRAPDGAWQQTRLWIVDDGASSWLHSAGTDWLSRFEGDPVVEIVRLDPLQSTQ